MTSEELQQRFMNEIERRGVDDKYIDGIEERELLQIGLQHGFTTDQARSFLVTACQERGYVIEAAVVQKIRESLRQRIAPRGLDRHGFENVLSDTRPTLAGTTRSDHDLRRLVVTTIDDASPRIRRGWFTDWFAKVKRETFG